MKCKACTASAELNESSRQHRILTIRPGISSLHSLFSSPSQLFSPYENVMTFRTKDLHSWSSKWFSFQCCILRKLLKFPFNLSELNYVEDNYQRPLTASTTATWQWDQNYLTAQSIVWLNLLWVIHKVSTLRPMEVRFSALF